MLRWVCGWYHADMVMWVGGWYHADMVMWVHTHMTNRGLLICYRQNDALLRVEHGSLRPSVGQANEERVYASPRTGRPHHREGSAGLHHSRRRSGRPDRRPGKRQPGLAGRPGVRVHVRALRGAGWPHYRSSPQRRVHVAQVARFHRRQMLPTASQ